MSKRSGRQEELKSVPLSPSNSSGGNPVAQPLFFLRSKLLPPRPAPALLQRPRLIERLVANLVHPVTLVTANAGSGKTTLVADFVRTHARPFIWYQLDHTDADPAVFLGYITHGIRQVIPEFGQATLAYLQQAAAEVGQNPERAVDILLNEMLDRIEQPLILVLDDYHHLGLETPVHTAVDRLLAYLPEVIHTIIISRDLPPLQLARLRSQEALTIIDRSDLLFTDDETQTLFRQVFDLEMTPQQLAEYRERTQGWITALQLVRQVAQRQISAQTRGLHAGAVAHPNLPNLTDILRLSERDIFDYFAEEVFAGEPEHVQHLLLRLSLLERIDLETCGQLYPDAGCAAILPVLVRRNVFITIASDESGEEYRLHPLFQSFLRRRLRMEASRAGVAAEQARIAYYFLEQGKWGQAIRYLLAAEEFEDAAAVIAEKGQEWIASGGLASLVWSVDALPAQVLERYPRALTFRAEVARLRGEYDVAQTLLQRASKLLREQMDGEGEADALHSLAAIARRRGEIKEAFDYLDRAIELTDERSAIRTKCGNTRGLCLYTLQQWNEAEREFRTALQLAEEQQNEHCARMIVHNLGLPPLIRGDFGGALRWLRRLLADDQRYPPVPQEAIAHLNTARCYFYRGEFEACEQHLERALERCQLFNLIELSAETLEAFGNLHRERGDMARAVDFYDRAARVYDEARIDLARHELLDEQASLKLQLGELTAARALLDRLIEARHTMKDEMGVQTAMLARGRVMFAQGELEQAQAELEPAYDYFRQKGLYYFEAQACIVLAACDYSSGNEARTLELLARALDLAARYDYEYWMQRQVAQYAHLFSIAEVFELLPPELREQLTTQPAPRKPERTAPALAPIIGLRVDLTIHMLGNVEIFRDPLRPFAADAWTTKRAREILCFIASRRHRRASKDTIIDIFWGEADLEVVTRNFHPTVSHIRKALNSNQSLKQNFLLYRDGDYFLNADFSYSIDVEEFDRLVSESDAARRAGQHESSIAGYEAAVKLYRGVFMNGNYDEWVEEQRSYYRERYFHLLEVLVIAAQKKEEWPRSLHLAQQILHDDPFREDIHRLVMRAHAAQGNRVAVKEQYETLRSLLRKELGVEPAAETMKIYRQLLA
ncbi:MAG: tetratricopeptide repeat protein [Acidobacteria bacterium]|nr:tetratricopeptide repeat protein [Acidobacteriota bacterium]